MSSAAVAEALDLGVIRSIVRSITNEHWSVVKAFDEYDIPEELREKYEALISECFVD